MPVYNYSGTMIEPLAYVTPQMFGAKGDGVTEETEDNVVQGAS